MAIEYLTADHLALIEVTNRTSPEYVAFMQRMMPGDAGRAIVAQEGITQQAIKNRLDAIAEVLGITLRYLPGSSDEVVFEAVHVSSQTLGERRRQAGEGVTTGQ